MSRLIYTKYKSKLWNSWRGMKERCTNPNHKNYNLYKGKLCKEWYDCNTFCQWALNNGYKEGLSIDRIDTYKGYTPENCQWITKSENTIKGNTERKLKTYKYKDSEYTCKELSKLLNINYHKLHQQLNRQNYTINYIIELDKKKKM